MINNSCECLAGTYSISGEVVNTDPSTWLDPNKSFCAECHYSCKTCVD